MYAAFGSACACAAAAADTDADVAITDGAVCFVL